MFIKRILLVSCYAMSAFVRVLAFDVDTGNNYLLDDIQIFATTKENVSLSEMPQSVSSISLGKLGSLGISSIKSIGSTVPNFFMPQYGSRLTSSIYIRGIGSRINSPAVGLYVDDIPYYEKSAFDFHFFDVERVDVLRGPQGTLYGRNTMGGLIRIETRNPFVREGSQVKVGYGSGNNDKTVSVNRYDRLGDKLAYSIGGYYEESDGFFTESLNAGGGRTRIMWFPVERLKIDYSIGADYSKESAYPYFYGGTIQGTEPYPEQVGLINNNRYNGYARTVLNTGLSLQYQLRGITLNSVTAFQGLDDCMDMDQDFLSTDLFTIQQKQRSYSLSQEITAKSSGYSVWQWVSGLNLFCSNVNSSAPVTFRSDGITWLSGLINSKIPNLSLFGLENMAVVINNPELPIEGRFDTPIDGFALFHQSTYDVTECLSFILGLRAEYEKYSIDYNSYSNVDVSVSYVKNGAPIDRPSQVAPALIGSHKSKYWQFMPKFSAKYMLPSGIVYATAARGYRSGGYNIQMFSDLLQLKMQTSMMSAFMGSGSSSYSQNDGSGQATSFKPEFSWNYEIGAHQSLFGGDLATTLAFFYIETKDQQLSKFLSSGLGRAMVNAGRSRCYGTEISVSCTALTNATLYVNYGYTNAEFTDYNDGSADYSGNKVPFAPENTVKAGVEYRFNTQGRLIDRITLGVDYNGAGAIYWTESNNSYQNYYSTFDAHATILWRGCSVNIWARNITDTQYRVFSFESMGRNFYQKNRPCRVGVDLNLEF